MVTIDIEGIDQESELFKQFAEGLTATIRGYMKVCELTGAYPDGEWLVKGAVVQLLIEANLLAQALDIHRQAGKVGPHA